jgi:proteasome activator subunit 4
MSTGLFVLQSCSHIVIDDLTRPELQVGDSGSGEGGMDIDGGDSVPTIEVDEGGELKLTRKQEDDAIRTMTAGFPDWVSSFFRGVLAVFEALPGAFSSEVEFRRRR